MCSTLQFLCKASTFSYCTSIFKDILHCLNNRTYDQMLESSVISVKLRGIFLCQWNRHATMRCFGDNNIFHFLSVPARSQQQSEWSTKQIVTQNFSKLQYRLTPRPHLTESGPRWTTKSTATSTETSLELGTNDAVTYSHNEFPNREVTTVSGVTSLSIEEEHSRRIR